MTDRDDLIRIIENAFQNSYPVNNKPRKVRKVLYQGLVKISKTLKIDPPPEMYIDKDGFWICSLSCIQKIIALLPLIPGVAVKVKKKVIRWNKSFFLNFMLELPILKSKGKLTWTDDDFPINSTTIKGWLIAYRNNIIKIDGVSFALYAEAEYALKLYINDIKKLVPTIDIDDFDLPTQELKETDVPDIQ